MPRGKKIATCDCETDPFRYGRKPEPFIWGLYDGKEYSTFASTAAFVAAVRDDNIILYAHNGGKFDFIYLLPYIRETKAQIINGRIVSMFLDRCELRDSYSIIPVTLRELGGKKDIEYWKLEREHRSHYKHEIGEYLYHDCKSLYDAVSAYRNAAGKQKTIASNALAFSRKLGIDPGKTNQRFDRSYRAFYFGGRTECFVPGTHSNLTILDIRSCYPYAMMHDHATGEHTDFHSRHDFGRLDRVQIQRSFIRLECTSRGAFPIRTNGPQGLYFPDDYHEFYVTGWEYIAAKDLGLIANEKIISVDYSTKTINFTPYVQHWFKVKSSVKKKDDPITYTIGKIMMNSLYGKLAQNPAKYFDYRIVPEGTPFCHCRQNEQGLWDYNVLCPIKEAENHGWKLEMEYEGHEIHRRESLWKYKFAEGKEWTSKPIYKNVATGASITGFARAHLLRAIHTVGRQNVVYCDTDSLVVGPEADLSNLDLTDEIGAWEIEARNAPKGHFAGKKLYGIVLADGSHKLASKGAKLTFGDIERISQGEIVTWQNEAPSFDLAGNARFVVRNIRSTAHISNHRKDELAYG